jgi:hypothetical protein
MKLVIHYRCGLRVRRLKFDNAHVSADKLAEEFGKQRKSGGSMSFHDGKKTFILPASGIELIEVRDT